MTRKDNLDRIARFIGSFKEYPPSQRVGSVNLDQVMETPQSGAGK